MLEYADVVIGLSYGDEGKGKVTNSLLKNNDYTHCVRFNGGHNAGHTVYKDDKKVVTHIVPTGVVQGVKSIIGPGCVTNTAMLHEEIFQLQQAGITTKGKLFIDKRANMITAQHVYEDESDTRIGTTKRGNGPAYRDKYARKNMRFGDFVWENENYQVCDLYEELYDTNKNKVLMEGAQAFGLDVDWGDYPYVTSSHCGVGGAVQNGIPFNKIRNVYGVCKAYDTYVGAKKFETEDPVFSRIRELGMEFGATTGRARQVSFLDLDLLVRSARLNGVTHAIINKVDVLEQVDTWKVSFNGTTKDLGSKSNFKYFVSSALLEKVDTIREITYSESPKDI